MGIIDRIKNFWKNRKIKALPPPVEEKVDNHKSKAWILNNNSNNPKQLTKLEYNIDKFLDAYFSMVEQIDLNTPVDMESIAYGALVTMNGMPVTEDELNNNGFFENNLLNKINLEQKYVSAEQGGFYHIRQPNYIAPPNGELVRLYINCKNENTAALTQTLLDNNTNPNFYIKFISNDDMSEKRYSRGEKLVIYCSKEEVQYTLELIEYAKNLRPDLFVGSEETLPFIQNYNNVASLAMEPENNQFTDLQGRNRIIAKSTNKYIANILKDSFREAVNEIARVDPNIESLASEEYSDNDYWHAKNIKYVKENYHDYLISSMEAKIEWLSKQNNIYIDGIRYQQNDNEKNQETPEYEK